MGTNWTPLAGVRVAVVGLGTVGSELAVALAGAGAEVIGIEADSGLAAAGAERAARRCDSVAARQHWTDARLAAAHSRLTVVADRAAASGCALLVEALPENLAVKRQVLTELAAVCDPATIAIGTALALPTATVVNDTGWQGRACGVRYLTSWDAVRLVEVVELPGAPVAADQVAGILSTLGMKVWRTAANGRAPVPLALLMGLLNTAAWMQAEDYASVADIDTAMKLGCGWPVGPLQLLDQIGLDCALDVLGILAQQTGRKGFVAAPVIHRLVAAGRLGVKAGAGFYRYPEQSGPGHGAATRPGGPVPPIERVGIVGSGTMATGIAAAVIRAGLPVALVGRSPARAMEATGAARQLAGAGATGQLTGSDSVAALDDCDVVIEAVVEDLAVKQRVMAAVDRRCGPGTLLATTTSSLRVADCAAATTRPEQVVGLHFFNPVPAMRLVELVTTGRTAPAAVRVATTLCERLDKAAVVCKDRAGFIVNRLLFPMINDAVTAVQAREIGSDPLDAFLRLGMGLPMGPIRLLDVIGADVALAVQERLCAEFGASDLAPASALRELVSGGDLGTKVGRSVRTHLSSPQRGGTG